MSRYTKKLKKPNLWNQIEFTIKLLDTYQITFVPWLRSRPNDENHAAPRLHMAGAAAIVSTLFTVVGQPNKPISAGNGGFKRGLPCLPSMDSSRAWKFL